MRPCCTPRTTMGKGKACRKSAVGNKASKKAVDALVDLSVLTAAAAAVEAAAAPKKGTRTNTIPYDTKANAAG